MEQQTNHITEENAYRILYWCISEFGRSKLNGKYPHIELVSKDENEENNIAYYDEIEDTIYLFPEHEELTTLTDLVKTVIHEYAHYRFHSMAEYKVLAKYLPHHKNPLEKDAIKYEKKYYKKCLKYLNENYGLQE